MTKGELLSALSNFSNEQYVTILLVSDLYPKGACVAVQEVVTLTPWHEGSPKIIGLLAHDQNKQMPPYPPRNTRGTN